MATKRTRGEKLDRFLMIYGRIQLWTFIITMVMVAVIYLVNPSVHYYEVATPEQESLQVMIEGLDIIDETQTSAVEFQKISQELSDEITKKSKRQATIAFICIIGWLFSQKEKRQKLKIIKKEILKKIKKLYNDEGK